MGTAGFRTGLACLPLMRSETTHQIIAFITAAFYQATILIEMFSVSRTILAPITWYLHYSRFFVLHNSPPEKPYRLIHYILNKSICKA